ncbi:hypothetical protein LJK87_18705 [Paenibacillus sp. P25]|nr:hypothetical protein LJK87_18705 [Paenibacillus sp. P25]
MKLEAGKVMRLEVAREVSPLGYFLTGGGQDVLLHYSETDGEVKPGQEVEVFLFYDTEDRLAATMRKPLITLDEVAPLEVVDIHPRFGRFLEMGLGRHLLLPFREPPELKELRPQVGTRCSPFWRTTVKGVWWRSSPEKTVSSGSASTRRPIGATGSSRPGCTSLCRWGPSSYATGAS